MTNVERSFGQEEPDEDFYLQQYNNPEILEINGEKIAVVDILPKEAKSEIPTYFAGGFTSSAEDGKDGILKTAQAGRRVIAPFATHGVRTSNRQSDIAHAEMRKLELMMEIMEAKHLETMNVIATSEGSIYTTAAAVLYPEKFQNIVLIEPAGLIGKDNLYQLLKRVIDNDSKLSELKKVGLPEHIKDAKYASNLWMQYKSMLLNPKATFGELKAIANADITGALEKIHGKGIGLSIIHAADDRLFPMERVQEMVDARHIDGFYSVWGTHEAYYLFDPFGKAAEAALTALEKRHQK